MNIKVYHGGTAIIENPRVDAGRANLDFGLGFYITDIRQQAVDWVPAKPGDNRQTSRILWSRIKAMIQLSLLFCRRLS